MTEDEIQEALEPFVNEGYIDDVLHVVKSGKEATVYCCAAGERTGVEYLAAKIYRPIEERSFRNDSMYREGRVILERRGARAVAGKTQRGREVQFALWMNEEWETLRLLHRAGADVPKVIARSSNAILMDFIGSDGQAAPLLTRVHLSQEEARPLLDVVLRNIELWLRHDRIHGDLSPFNILYHEGRLVVIDFPQAVDPRFNRFAFDLLLRDLDRVCSHFARYGVHADAARIADRLWWRFINSEL